MYKWQHIETYLENSTFLVALSNEYKFKKDNKWFWNNNQFQFLAW